MSERNKVSPELLIQLENYATMFLNNGRTDWDKDHTKSVVHYVTKIAKNESLDVLVLTTVAWLHDTGYYGRFPESDSNVYDKVQKSKKEHMEKSAEYAREFFLQPGIKDFYRDEQMQRIIHIISIHDNVSDLRDLDEIAFMEADTLGAIDITRATPTFKGEEAENYIVKSLYGKRHSKFQTPTGIKLFEELAPAFIDYVIRTIPTSSN